MRHYETIYIINPNLADEDYREIIEKFKSQIEQQKGVVIKTQEWGKQNLAYLIKKFDKGYYILIEFCAEQELVATLERGLKLDDRILKYQTVKLADKVDPEELLKKQQDETKKADVHEEDQGLGNNSLAQDQDNEIYIDYEADDGDE